MTQEQILTEHLTRIIAMQSDIAKCIHCGEYIDLDRDIYAYPSICDYHNNE